MTTEIKPGGRTRLRAVTLLLATFAAGALVGVASQQLLSADEPGRGEMRREMIRDHNPFAPGGELAERLALTEAQRAEIERIVHEDRAKADSIFHEMRPRLRARYDSTTAAIRGVMTPEQQVEFDRFRAERRVRIRGKFIVDDGNRRHDEGR